METSIPDNWIDCLESCDFQSAQENILDVLRAFEDDDMTLEEQERDMLARATPDNIIPALEPRKYAERSGQLAICIDKTPETDQKVVNRRGNVRLADYQKFIVPTEWTRHAFHRLDPDQMRAIYGFAFSQRLDTFKMRIVRSMERGVLPIMLRNRIKTLQDGYRHAVEAIDGV